MKGRGSINTRYFIQKQRRLTDLRGRKGNHPGFSIQVRGGPEKRMVTGWAQIMRINKEIVGTYICVATNSEGEARAAAKISLVSNKDGRDESLNEI